MFLLNKQIEKKPVTSDRLSLYQLVIRTIHSTCLEETKTAVTSGLTLAKNLIDSFVQIPYIQHYNFSV